MSNSFNMTQDMSQERKDLKINYNKILSRTHDYQTKSDMLDESFVSEAIKEANNLYKHINRPDEVYYDAKVVSNLSKITLLEAKKFSTNVKKFHLFEFSDIIMNFLNVQIDSSDNDRKMELHHFAKLGKKVNSFVKRVPYLSFLNGAISETEVEPKEKKVRQSKPKQEVHETQFVELTESQSSTNLTEVLVEHAFRELLKNFEANGKKPINYFQYVVDPLSYGKTVENTFHVSFLIKEGKVRVKMIDTIPFIQPVKKSEFRPSLDGRALEKNNISINMTMNKWEIIKKKLNLVQPMITPKE